MIQEIVSYYLFFKKSSKQLCLGGKKEQGHGRPVLEQKSKIAIGNEERAELLNSYFSLLL